MEKKPAVFFKLRPASKGRARTTVLTEKISWRAISLLV
jgi:hypothetical protein